MPKTALVIDDSRAIRMILSKQLQGRGFEVREAGNGKEALTAANAMPSISLALVDWNMPEMNGLEFIKAFRAQPRYKAVKVVMVTTETEMEQMLAALEAGANDYVMKPFTSDVITEKLELLGL